VVRCWRWHYREKDRVTVRRFSRWYGALSRLGFLVPAAVVITATLGSCAGSADSPSGVGQSGGNAGQPAEQSGEQSAESTVSPSGDGQPGENAGQQVEQPGEQPAGPTVAAGQPLTVGNAEWVVTYAYPATQLFSEYGDPPITRTKQGDFVVVDFRFKNNSAEGVTVNTESLALFDGNGRKYKFDTDIFFYIDSSRNIFLVEVGPGDTMEGQIIFKVAPDGSQFRLQLGEANPFSDKKGYVNLGF
jgi:uncharacterized protein DUF4352